MKLNDRHGRIPNILRYGILITTIGIVLSLAALWVMDSIQEWTFSRPHKIQPGTNPNHFYVVQLQSIHLVGAGQDFIVRAEVSLRNRGSSVVNLNANTIKLVDSVGISHDPTFAPDMQPLQIITPQKNTTIWLVYTVPAGALDGEMKLAFDARHSVLIKNAGQTNWTLQEGEARVFRKLTW